MIFILILILALGTPGPVLPVRGAHALLVDGPGGALAGSQVHVLPELVDEPLYAVDFVVMFVVVAV